MQELSTSAPPPQARNAHFLALKNSPAAEPLGLHPSGHPQASSPLFTRGSLKRQCKTRQERKKTAPPTQTQALAILRVLEAKVGGDRNHVWGSRQSKAPENLSRETSKFRVSGSSFPRLRPRLRVRCPQCDPATTLPRSAALLAPGFFQPPA